MSASPRKLSSKERIQHSPAGVPEKRFRQWKTSQTRFHDAWKLDLGGMPWEVTVVMLYTALS